MKIVRIPKRRGGYRLVVVPSRYRKRKLREILPWLERVEREIAAARGVSDVAHGFVPGRSPVSGALRHIGYDCTVCCDIVDWFNNVRYHQVLNRIAHRYTRCDEFRVLDRLGFVRLETSGHRVAAQGLPTSPALANIAAVYMDQRLTESLGELLQSDWVYTRYADDLSVSWRGDTSHDRIAAVCGLITSVVSENDWILDTSKWSVYLSRGGRRIVTGISVGASDIRIPRFMRRRLRAARFQNPYGNHTRGLEEWSRLRWPRGIRSRSIATSMPDCGVARPVVQRSLCADDGEER